MRNIFRLLLQLLVLPALGKSFAGGINLTTTAAALKTGTLADSTHMESLRATAAENAPVSPNFPATATSPGTTGQLAFDATHVYICIATNTWVRAVTATF